MWCNINNNLCNVTPCSVNPQHMPASRTYAVGQCTEPRQWYLAWSMKQSMYLECSMIMGSIWHFVCCVVGRVCYSSTFLNSSGHCLAPHQRRKAKQQVSVQESRIWLPSGSLILLNHIVYCLIHFQGALFLVLEEAVDVATGGHLESYPWAALCRHRVLS